MIFEFYSFFTALQSKVNVFFHPDPAKSPQDKIWERMREKMNEKKKEQKERKKYVKIEGERGEKSEIGNEKERAKQKALSALRK